MLDEAMKVSLTLVAFDKMSKVIRDAVQKSNDDFHKMQAKIKDTSEKMKKTAREPLFEAFYGKNGNKMLKKIS